MDREPELGMLHGTRLDRIAAFGATLTLATVLASAADAQTAPPQPAPPTQQTAPKAASSAFRAEQTAMAPHRAVYEVTLDTSRSASGVTDMTGRMVFEITGSACDGFNQSMRFVTRITGADGSTSVTDMRSSSWEDALSRTFRFTSSQYKDQKLSESTNGEATRPEISAEGKVELTRPEKKELPLKAGVYFPIQHSIALLAAAKRGDSVFLADLYDGSEKGEKTYNTTSYIGRMHPAGHNATLPKVDAAAPLNGLRSWPVSISYFEAGAEKKDAMPAYELAFLYFENGVSRRLFIDYGDFAIRGELKDITFLEPTKCEPKKQ